MTSEYTGTYLYLSKRYGPNAKSALVNARLINHCNKKCCTYAQGDSMDTYEYYGKLNKKTQKFKPGSKSIYQLGSNPEGPSNTELSMLIQYGRCFVRVSANQRSRKRTKKQFRS